MEKMPSSIELPSEKISHLLKEVLHNVDILEFNEKMVAFAEKLRENHPDFYYYRCYHQLIGSTPPEHADIEEDFEGEDSVVGFLEGILKTKTQS